MSRSGGSPVLAAALLAVAIVAVAGCGEEESETPAACLGPPAAYLDALEEAPAPVRLEDATPISDCLVSDQEPAEIARVGEPMIAAATRLNAAARRDPAGAATVRLGYLVGAAQEGASAELHTDLLRRLDAAARFNPGGEPLPARFERAFGEGYATGQEHR